MEDSVFTQYLRVRSLFKRDRDILRPSYIPISLPHRGKEIDQLASILATALRGNRPSNVLIFGKSGTGKTAVVKFLGQEIRKVERKYSEESPQEDDNGSGLEEDSQDKIQDKIYERSGNGGLVNYLYINCQTVDTQYGVLQNIGNTFVRDFNEIIPFTGWPTERVYNVLRDKIDEKDRVVIIVLDEIDRLVCKSGDEVLYHLSKINDDLQKAKVSIIGISNDLKFTEFLDPRVRSRLGEEKLVFPPYNAEQLSDILRQRADLAFEDGVLADGVIPLCAAFAAQEHGDARRALELLRVASELAEREQNEQILPYHVNKAKNKIELDCITEVVRTLPSQSKMILYGIILHTEAGNDRLTTGDVYDIYTELCRRSGMSSLTQRRITDLISELDMLGIINARLISKGRYGRTREITLSVPTEETKRVILEDELLSEVSSIVIKNGLISKVHQQTLI